MTGLAAARPKPSAARQWWVLTMRAIAPTVRNGELLVAISLSGIFTVCLYFPLKGIMGTVVHVNYAQFVMPVIALQAVQFSAMSAAIRSSTDALEGINVRFGSMPIQALTPLAARMSAAVYRCGTAIVTAILFGYLIGFRFYRGPACILGFCVLVLFIGITLSFVADLLGIVLKNPQALVHILLLPLLILGILSAGLQPVEQFPEWLQPFVRDQFNSQFVYVLRAFAGDAANSEPQPSWSIVGPSLLWLAGIIAVTVPAYILALRRR
jgi:ABC-2 type transport system permease protein